MAFRNYKSIFLKKVFIVTVYKYIVVFFNFTVQHKLIVMKCNKAAKSHKKKEKEFPNGLKAPCLDKYVSYYLYVRLV